jgi:purine nucleoside phosphorylase
MVGLIGGSGLADALLGEVAGREEHIDTPFGSTSTRSRGGMSSRSEPTAPLAMTCVTPSFLKA